MDCIDFTPENMDSVVFGSETILSVCMEANTPLMTVGKVSDRDWEQIRTISSIWNY